MEISSLGEGGGSSPTRTGGGGVGGPEDEEEVEEGLEVVFMGQILGTIVQLHCRG